jgi:N-acetyltransferase
MPHQKKHKTLNLDLQPTLENELVLIRPLLEQDFEPLYQAARDPLIWEQHAHPNRYKRNDFELFFRDSMDSKGALLIIDKKNGTVIGSSRFKASDLVNTAAEIGWTFLSRKYWGGKYNLLVKSLMIDHAFKFYKDVIFYVGECNIRSQKAIEKIGSKKTTEVRYCSATPNNALTYRINRDDWKRMRGELLRKAGLY